MRSGVRSAVRLPQMATGPFEQRPIRRRGGGTDTVLHGESGKWAKLGLPGPNGAKGD